MFLDLSLQLQSLLEILLAHLLELAVTNAELLALLLSLTVVAEDITFVLVVLCLVVLVDQESLTVHVFLMLPVHLLTHFLQI